MKTQRDQHSSALTGLPAISTGFTAPRLLSLAALIFGLAVSSLALEPASIDAYFVAKELDYLQSSSAIPTSSSLLISPEGAFHFMAGLAGSNLDQLSPTPKLALPNASQHNLTGTSDVLVLAMTYSNKSALDAAFPNGTYRFTGGTYSLPISLGGANDGYATEIPQITNGTWNGQGQLVINAAIGGTLNFNNFSNYYSGIGGEITFSLYSVSNNNLENELVTLGSVTVPGYSSDPALTSYTIPAGYLQPNQTYFAGLSFTRLADLNTSNLPSVGMALLMRSTGFYISTGVQTSAPTFTTQPANQTVNPGSSVTFSAAASGTPTPSYQWRKNGTDISAANGNTYTIASATAGDAGAYTVVATNSAGSVTSAVATLTVNLLSVGRKDFNGDGKAEILWTNTATGDRAMWQMSGTTLNLNTFMGTVPVDWTISGTGDFDGDGKADLFWTNTATGDRAVWLMNGCTLRAGGYLGSIPVDWAVSNTGDCDGDGKTDILWTNTATGERAIWLMNGLTTSGGASLGVVPVAWVISGTGDFNGDGKTDILLSNTVSGDRAMWFMHGTTISTNAFVGTVPATWAVSGTGDFNGDGKADIFWSNTVTGDRAVWLMNGSTLSIGGYLGSVPVEWMVSSTGDFNGDGKSDLLWSNAATGERAIWLMNGSTTSGGASLGVVPAEWVAQN